MPRRLSVGLGLGKPLMGESGPVAPRASAAGESTHDVRDEKLADCTRIIGIDLQGDQPEVSGPRKAREVVTGPGPDVQRVRLRRICSARILSCRHWTLL